MASNLFQGGREGFLGGDLDWNGHTIKICLVDSDEAGPVAGAWKITNVTNAGTTVTVTAAANHGLTVGDTITIWSVGTITNVNNTTGVPTHTVATQNGTTGFTFTDAIGTPTGSYSSGGYLVNLSKRDLADYDGTGSPIVASATLGSPTITDGVADAADTTFTAVTGAVSEALLIYDDTHASDRMIAHIDSATGLPVTPNGGDIVVVYSSAAEKIFRL